MLFFEDIPVDEPTQSRSLVVEKDDIISFASQWDPQPFHTDEEAAKAWPLGLTASGVHTFAISAKLGSELGTEPSAVVAGFGWDEVRLLAPVRPGDALRVRGWVSEKRESRSKPNMGIIVSRVEVLNQRDEVVLSYKIPSMILKRPPDGRIPDEWIPGTAS